MRRLLIDIFLLGLLSGAACGVGLTLFEIVQFHWFLGFDVEFFGLRFQGEDGGITYPVGRNGLFNLALSCAGGWLAWGLAALNRAERLPEAANPPRLERSAWFLAVVCGCAIVLLWVAMHAALRFDILSRYRPLLRLILLSLALVFCIDRMRYCWTSQRPPASVGP